MGFRVSGEGLERATCAGEESPSPPVRATWLSGLGFMVYLSIRCILGDIRLWVGHTSTSSCLVFIPRVYHELWSKVYGWGLML